MREILASLAPWRSWRFRFKLVPFARHPSSIHAKIAAVSEELQLFCSAPHGVSDLLAKEIEACGGRELEVGAAGVSFRGDLGTAYELCLRSRVGNRVLVSLSSFDAPDEKSLYAGARAIDWSEHMAVEQSFRIDAVTQRSSLDHTQFVAQKVKDALVDQWRETSGERPSVSLESPHIRVHVLIRKDVATLSLDLSGESLHRRGYRTESGPAPLKENLAAAVLLRAGWPEIAARGGCLVDPMCGSATFLIEAAMMATGTPPGHQRSFGFEDWRKHDPQLWNEIRTRAEGRTAFEGTIIGLDHDSKVLEHARANIERAGVRAEVAMSALEDVAPPAGPAGLVVTNPPYGERLGDDRAAEEAHRTLGTVLRERFDGWNATVITEKLEHGFAMGLKAHRRNKLRNGPIDCSVLHFRVQPERYREEEHTPHPASEMFANRLRKNLKRLGKWAKRNDISCYRVYDADLPEYAAAIDIYPGYAHIQEYAPPASVPQAKSQARLKDMVVHTSSVLGIAPEHVFVKVRRKQKGKQQYERQGREGTEVEVHEGENRFVVNLSDYLDTGLFLDHRNARQLIGSLAKGRRFLNLFCYTGTATVHAASAGATLTTSVDLSNTYLEWAERNMDLNGLGGRQHRFIRADCLAWAAEAKDTYDLIFLDPPTFSNSKRMDKTWDVQRDHPELLENVLRLLAPGGILIFSTNSRKFSLEEEALQGVSKRGIRWKEITDKTRPEDFARNPRIHRCFQFERES